MEILCNIILMYFESIESHISTNIGSSLDGPICMEMTRKDSMNNSINDESSKQSEKQNNDCKEKRTSEHAMDSIDILYTCKCRCRERDKQSYMCLAPKYKICSIIGNPMCTKMTIKTLFCRHFASCDLSGTTCKPENITTNYTYQNDN